MTEMTPETPPVTSGGEPSEAVPPVRNGADFVAESRTALAAGDTPRAVAIAREGTATGSPVAWYQLGRCLVAANDEPGAVEAFESALQREPRHPGAHAALGRIRAHRGEAAAAVLHFEAVADALPGDAGARRNLASALHLLGAQQLAAEADAAAAATLARAAEFAPTDAGILNDLGVDRIGAGDAEGAVAAARAALGLLPDDARLHLGLGT